MGPLIPNQLIDGNWNNLIALLIGIAFGFVLESSGFSSSRVLAGVFYGYDFTVLRVFFTAAITAMSGLLFFNHAGWLDYNMLYVNPYYIQAAIVGGVVMGLGFILGGFCPGTSICGLAIGKIDALVFTGGMFLGILIFSEAFPMLQTLFEKNSLGGVRVYESLHIPAGLFALLLIVMALMAFYVTALIQKRVRKVEY
ncbi:MAG TPA: YeeE/YedE thiosulfate transporter family protein [Bacteroidales bacterium]|nr:YeeE/YedE family protein [Lentimicrobiaceae bacterium]HOI00964.1 YeeE/YedE thiosulfate transporter family protein [Bacteroidales bacterium]